MSETEQKQEQKQKRNWTKLRPNWKRLKPSKRALLYAGAVALVIAASIPVLQGYRLARQG